MSRKVKSCAGRSHGCEETFVGCHDSDEGKCVVQGSSVSGVRVPKPMEWPGRKELETEGKTISPGKDPEGFLERKGEEGSTEGKENNKPRKSPSPQHLTRALTRAGRD